MKKTYDYRRLPILIECRGVMGLKKGGYYILQIKCNGSLR